MKWWTKAEADGGHLRMLYPGGGPEDGTAEAHLETAAALDRARASGRHLLNLIEDVLDFSRIEAHRVTVRRAAARGLRLVNTIAGSAATVAYRGDDDRPSCRPT